MYGWTNEAGEPIMSGEAYRFEQYLDAMDAEQRPLDDYYYYDDHDPEDDCEPDHECLDCDGPGGTWTPDGVFRPFEGAHWTCSWCGRPCPDGAHDD